LRDFRVGTRGNLGVGEAFVRRLDIVRDCIFRSCTLAQKRAATT
jgi:hypothetical protein